MSDSQQAAAAVEQPIIDDAIRAEDTGFITDPKLLIEQEEKSPVLQAVNKEELKEEIEEAIENGASEKEVKDLIKEFEIKVNGKMQKKKINLSDEAAVKRELQLAAAAQPAMQRAKELEKAYDRELKRLKSNPWEVLQELGLNPEELSAQYLQSRVEEMKKSPEQVEKEKLQSDLQKAREELNRQKEEAETARFQQLREKEAVQLEKEIMDALDSHKTLPKSQRTISRIADALLWAMEEGYENVSVADVIPAVEADLRGEISGLMDDMPEEVLEEWVGKKNIERLRKKRLSSKPQPQVTDVKPTSKSVTQENKEPAKRMRSRDFFRTI